MVIVLNFTCSMLICIRILYVTRRTRKTLGHETSQAYTGVVALIVEAMLPYTLFGLVYVVTLGVNHPTSIFWLSVYVMMTVCAFHLRPSSAGADSPGSSPFHILNSASLRR